MPFPVLIAYSDSDVQFVLEGQEFVPWNPTDWKPNPAFLSNIRDPEFAEFAREVHAIWPQLGRQMREEVASPPFPEKYSLIYVPHPTIVPGGRFREFYYWDSYWIQIGLLKSEMYDTVEGMILNFASMVEHLGYIPNGGRLYYERSQPPFFIPMVKNYHEATGNDEFVKELLPTLVKEFRFWEEKRAVTFEFTNGRQYKMFRYNSAKNGPRPESYM